METVGTSDSKLSRKIASKIKKIDEYFGYLAWSEVFTFENNKDRSLSILKELISFDANRPEAYFKLWKHFYSSKLFRDSELIAASAFVRVTQLTFSHYFIVFCICYSKSYFQTGKIRGSLELLQQKYMEHRKFGIFLYQYGRLCIKSGEDCYLICGITALEECLRVCDVSLHGKVWFWLGVGYNSHDFLMKSNSSLQKALKMLPSNDLKKIAEINLILGRQSALISKLKQIENNKNLMKHDEILQKISETHPVEGILAFGKSIWTHSKEEGFKFLYNYRSTVTRCDFFFLMFQFAKERKDFTTLKKQSKKLIEKLKGMNVTTSDWLTSHIWYAKSLTYTGKPEKSLILLKCLGKVFPSIPYLEQKYTKFLSSAETVEDLMDCSDINQSSRQSVHIVSNAYLQALASQNVPLFLQERKDLAQQIYSTDPVFQKSPQPSTLFEDRNSTRHSRNPQMSKFSQYSKFASQNFEFMMEKRSKNEFFGFSLSSDPEFLRIIAKVALRAEDSSKDGLLAIEDYLEIVEDQKRRANGMFYKAMLLYKEQNEREFLPLMQDLLTVLKGEGKKLDKIKKILDSR
jgi:hypothetical protein